MLGIGAPSAKKTNKKPSPNPLPKSLKINEKLQPKWTPSKTGKTWRPSCQLDDKMVPKVLSGATPGPQMATKIHHWSPWISPQALPSSPLSHTFAVILIFLSFLVPPASVLGATGAPRVDFGSPLGINFKGIPLLFGNPESILIQ